MNNIKVITNYPFAYDSEDFIFPVGAKQDNNTNPELITELVDHFKNKKFKVLDLGCAQGQFVVDMYNRGNLAVGLEGSDYNIKEKTENWNNYHNKALFTCDISREFQIEVNGGLVKFDYISCWEVLEHIPESRLDQTFLNIIKHCHRDTIFHGSIGLHEDITEGHRMHETVITAEEWYEKYLDKYFYRIPPITYHTLRGSSGERFCLKPCI